MFDRSRELVRELGWPSLRAMTEELSGIDLGALREQTEAFLAATEASYEGTVEPPLRAELGIGFDELRSAPTSRSSSARRRWTRVPCGPAAADASRRRSPGSGSRTARRAT